MRYALFVALLFSLHSSLYSQTPLSGIKTIPGSYPTLRQAIYALNVNGVSASGVTFNIAAGYTETFTMREDGYIGINATAAGPVIFQRSGIGPNPVITGALGTGSLDMVIGFVACDYITFDGIDVRDNPLATNNSQRMEFGFAFFKYQTPSVPR